MDESGHPWKSEVSILSAGLDPEANAIAGVDVETSKYSQTFANPSFDHATLQMSPISYALMKRGKQTSPALLEGDGVAAIARPAFLEGVGRF